VSHFGAVGVREHSYWRFVPITSALIMLALATATWGAGLILAPIGFAFTLLALRREPPSSRLSVIRAGLFLQAWLAVAFCITVGLIVADAA
jgi:hypothetical protein